MKSKVEFLLPSGGYPKSITQHLNRKFVLDNKYCLWWSEKDKFDVWYGDNPDADYSIDSAGYWMIKTDDVLTQIVSMYGNLYILGNSSLHVFSGDCNNNFALIKLYGE